VVELWQTFVQLVVTLGQFLGELLLLGLSWALLIAWLAWWLWGVNWKKAWPVLAQGAWVPAVLLIVLAALVWSQIASSDSLLFGFIKPTFWSLLACAGLLAGTALFCGWLQGVFGWTPAEVRVEPPPPAHHHGHHHGHH